MSTLMPTTRDVLERIARTLPCRVIRGDAGPYLERYMLTELPGGGSVYLHHFLRGDEDRALHNHPWAGHSLILVGGYREERRGHDDSIEVREFRAGDENTLAPDTFHRVDLLDGATCWTLFQTSARVQSWGFWDRETKAFTPWREYLTWRGVEVA